MSNPVKAVLAALGAFLSRFAPVGAETVEDATAAYDRGDYAAALRISRRRARWGDARSQLMLGVMYDGGCGLAQDDAAAVKWYRKAAERGNATAQHNLGSMYYGERGVAQDYAEAAKWFGKAADQGEAQAQGALGIMCHYGWGVPQDYAEAVTWFRKAAEQGNTDAQVFLGAMYAKGKGVPQDYAEAHRWYTLAAASYPASETEAREAAIKNRDEVASKMAPEQIAEVEKLAGESEAGEPAQDTE